MRMCQCTVNDKHRHSRERDKIKRVHLVSFFLFDHKNIKKKKKNQRAKNPPVATSERDLNAKHNCCTNNKKIFV
jgi:hypothetical protein